MHKVVVFGAGIYAKSIAKKSLNELADYEIVAFIDNDESKQGKFFKINNDKSIKIYSVDILKNIEFDRIIITTYTGYNEVTKQLLQLGIDERKIFIRSA